MAKRKSRYYKRLSDDMHDVYAERNILKAERDNARKSAEAYRRKLESAYADIERRESELREKEAKEIGEWAYEKQKMIIGRNKALVRGIKARDALIHDMFAQLLNAYDAKELEVFSERIQELRGDA